MIAVHFSKSYAEKVLAAIQSGNPISAPAGGWTGNHMLTLAGILYAAVFSQGPDAHHAGLDASILQKMHSERREAVEDSFHRDIHDGIEFLSTLVFQVLDGEYDKYCEGEVKAVVYEKEGQKEVLPAKGFKGHKDIV